MSGPADKRERRWLTWAVHLIFRFTRPMTLGVRGLILDAENRVFLVRHTYVPGWHLPGGGVETGETLEAAMAKELAEEGNIRLTGPMILHGVFFNGHVSPRDHVAVFVVRHFEQTAPRLPDREIAEAGFFPLDALPERTTRGTRARLAEVLESRPVTPDWEPRPL